MDSGFNEDLANLVIKLYDIPDRKQDRILLIEESKYPEEAELLYRILFDKLPDEIQYFYLFSETDDNLASVFGALKNLSAQFPKATVLLTGSEAISGYSGYAAWRKKVTSKVDNSVEPLEVSGPLNTGTEALALRNYLLAKSDYNVALISSALHQTRAFATFASIAGRINAFSYPGLRLDWDQQITHSQGIQKGTRRELLVEEIRKALSENAYRNISTPPVINEYIIERNNQVFGYDITAIL